MGEAGRDSKEDEDEKEPLGQGHEERPQLPPQALPDRPRTPPTRDEQGEARARPCSRRL